MSALAVMPVASEPVSCLSRRLADLLAHSEADGIQLPDAAREQATVLVEALRLRILRKPDRDHRSLFDLDDRLIELMGLVEEAADTGTEISAELAQEIDTYLEAYRLKVDQIVGFWRWQQSIADISAKEAERLAARKKAAENRVARLKGFLFAFMTARGIKKLEGEKSDIGMQRNSSASLVVDDPLQIAERFFERSIRFTKTEFQEVVCQLPEREMRRRLEAALKDGWEVNGEAVRANAGEPGNHCGRSAGYWQPHSRPVGLPPNRNQLQGMPYWALMSQIRRTNISWPRRIDSASMYHCCFRAIS